MPAKRRPSYDDLADLVVEQAAQIKELKAYIVVLEDKVVVLEKKIDDLENKVIGLESRNAELERLARSTSRNSSKPPSSDGLAKPSPKSLRPKGAKKAGGQPGHPGSVLRQVAIPDQVVQHAPEACGGCGNALDSSHDASVLKRQVFDLPAPRLIVTEHQLISRVGACGQQTTGTAPVSVNAPAQYGPRVNAYAVYLNAGQFLSRDRTAQTLGELFGCPLSPGTISSMVQSAGEGLGGFMDTVASRIAGSAVAHFDETGFRVADQAALGPLGIHA